ncbi:MAG TPA: hypothetical protein PK605_07140 [Ignavibacteria bacterium]|nr:hypothetical protein [Ignavibacteria bacterium]HRE09393.1 hypothetical protein [Ignavibacteria bacterium]HRF64518.1 hypothetical protein [Ignavibacteria bacterium]HRJ04160.1 hypothetical protein [Ignavibacteria bacterium]HRJ84479.1 hypothetical protein [Ignavibacteria bacterium]
MIEVILFYAHAVFFVYIFAKNYVEQNTTSAFLSTIFVIIIFTVGWTFSAFVIGFFIPDDGVTRILTKAAFSLGLLTLLELIFYKFYFAKSTVRKQMV